MESPTHSVYLEKIENVNNKVNDVGGNETSRRGGNIVLTVI